MGTDWTELVIKARDELEKLEAAEQLASLFASVLLARGERKSFAFEESDQKQIDEAGIDGEVKTSAGDLLDILKEGPQNKEQAASADALFALGVAKKLNDAEGPAFEQEVGRMLSSWDWLAVFSPLRPYAALGAALPPEAQAALWETVVDRLASEAKDEYPATPDGDAQKLLRLTHRANALAFSPEDQKHELAGAVAAEMPPGMLKRIALAAIAGVDDADAESKKEAQRNPQAAVRAATASRAPRLEGQIEGKPWGPVVRLLAGVTGILLLRWIVRLVAKYLLGFRRSGTVTLAANTLKVDEKVELLGREIRSGDAIHSLRSVRSGTVETRQRYLHLLVGALFLVLGCVLGVNYVVEGSVAAYPPLLGFGLLIIALGFALDIVLEIFVPARKGRVRLSFDMGRKWVRIQGIDAGRAGEFAEVLAQLLPPPKLHK